MSKDVQIRAFPTLKRVKKNSIEINEDEKTLTDNKIIFFTWRFMNYSRRHNKNHFALCLMSFRWKSLEFVMKVGWKLNDTLETCGKCLI